MNGWRLAGREREFAQVNAAISGQSFSAVFLVGDLGVGKTRLARECLEHVDDEATTILHVIATRAAATLPLGALAPLLPPLDVPEVMLLPAARQALLGGSAAGRTIVLIDDAHNLDEVSAALIHQMVSAKQIFALVTVEARETLPDALNALWKDEHALRVNISSLSDEQIEGLIAQALPGPVDLFATRELRRLAAGNPLTLRELISSAIDDGTLRRDEGHGWTVSGTLTAPRHMVDVIGQRISKLSPSSREALRIVALGEPVGYPLAAKLIDHAALRELEQSGLICVETTGLRKDVRLAHPMFGEAVLDMSMTERCQLLTKLAETHQATGLRRTTDVIRVADWRLQAGNMGDADLLVRAARRSLGLHDLRAAVRFASAARAIGAGITCDLLLGYAHAGLGDALAAESVFKDAMSKAARPEELARIAVIRSENLFSGLEDRISADAVAEEAVELLRGSPLADEVQAHRARLLMLSGESKEALRLAAPLVEGSPGRPGMLGATVMGTGLTWDGRPADGLELAAKAAAKDQQGGCQDPLQSAHVMQEVNRLTALLVSGGLAEAEKSCASLWAEFSETDLIRDLAVVVLTRGFIAREMGRLTTARHWYLRAERMFARSGTSRRRWALAALLEVEVHMGDHAAAHRVAQELNAARSGPVRNMIGMEDVALAWLAVAQGHIPVAERMLIEVAERSCASGARTVAVEALHSLARIGKAPLAHAMAERLSHDVQGPLLNAKLEMVLAAALQHAGHLTDVAQAFGSMGAWLFAAEAWAESSRIFTRRGDRRRATRSRLEAQNAMAKCEQARTPLITFTEATAKVITDREREVAVLAADGLSSKQIAERLFLSRRTVDNYLQQCYRKLGITRREQIRPLLSSVSCEF